MEETWVCLDADGKEPGTDSVGLVAKSQKLPSWRLCEVGGGSSAEGQGADEVGCVRRGRFEMAAVERAGGRESCLETHRVVGQH